MADISNLVYDEIEIGARASETRTLSRMDIEVLALAAGDLDNGDVDLGTTSTPATEPAGLAVFVSGLISRRLPGPGTTILEQNLRYRGRMSIGDQITADVVVRSKSDGDQSVVLDCRCINQAGAELLVGTVTAKAPKHRIKRDAYSAPELILRRGDGFARLIKRCAAMDPVRCAVVHPCDAAALQGAVAAAVQGLIVPVLVGPEAKIRAVAKAEGIDLSPYSIEAVPHSHAAAARAVELARNGKVAALMKGSLHTDELMAEVLSATGLRTERRISHVFVMDVPAYPRTLLVTDAAINIQPTLTDKADIVRNAIDLAHTLGIENPKVAILSAVETVNPNIASTIDAAALCKMADRGQITGGTLDGPLAFDNAINVQAARSKHIESAVAGQADVLVVPDLESGNILAKQLQYLAGASSSGIALGARVPIALTSRSDSIRSRVVSAALVVLSATAQSTAQAATLTGAGTRPGR
ncbi:MAG: bifunctional enoyl-CoA hydratase/phosphate acetyltransferase [Gammaproteobacteria bacterium]